MWPGFDSPIRRLMWAEFVGSLSCSERFFSGDSGFPPSPKTNISPTRPHKLTALNCIPCINKVSLPLPLSLSLLCNIHSVRGRSQATKTLVSSGELQEKFWFNKFLFSKHCRTEKWQSYPLCQKRQSNCLLSLSPSKQTQTCDTMAWQNIGELWGLADFLSRLLWSLVDKILSKWNTPVALVYNTRWQNFLRSKQKICLVRHAPKSLRWLTSLRLQVTSRDLLTILISIVIVKSQLLLSSSLYFLLSPLHRKIHRQLYYLLLYIQNSGTIRLDSISHWRYFP